MTAFPQIRLGTSSFTADGWNGSFYPKGMKSADYLGYYSSRFDTVEVDSTFYRCPAIRYAKSSLNCARANAASSSIVFASRITSMILSPVRAQIAFGEAVFAL